MNPLTLNGDAFLTFYRLFGVLVLRLVWEMRNIVEAGTLPRLDLTDP
jgi:hypothetical protein